MTQFSLITVWQIPATVENCWFCLLDREHWPHWWPYITSVEPLRTGSKDGVGDICRYRWNTCLPYHLTVDITVTDLKPFEYIRYSAAGDLLGDGSCRFYAEERQTRIRFCWRVSPNKSWMKLMAPWAAPIFIWNHQHVMKKGEQSFRQRLISNT